MAAMMSIDGSARRSEPLVRIYGGRCVLNKHAASLLHITEGDKVEFLQDMDEAKNGRDRIYVCKSLTKGYRVSRRGQTLRINSVPLVRRLKDHLDGEGTYRICPEVIEIYCGRECYNIFFRKYDKE